MQIDVDVLKLVLQLHRFVEQEPNCLLHSRRILLMKNSALEVRSLEFFHLFEFNTIHCKKPTKMNQFNVALKPNLD